MEKVMCIRRKLLDNLGAFQGVEFNVERYLSELNPRVFCYVGRDVVETDYSYKQIIPYVVVVCGSQILRYSRGKKGGEGRLNDNLSIGVGGHLNSDDDNYVNPYDGGLSREIREELGVEIPSGSNHTVFQPLALVNDDSNDVGRAHLGIVHVLEVTTAQSGALCDKLPDAEWRNIKWLQADINQEFFATYEGWSKILLPNLNQIVGKFHDLRFKEL